MMKGRLLERTEEERNLNGGDHGQCETGSPMCKGGLQTDHAEAVLGQITWAFHYRDKEVYLGLHRQYIRPHLEFSVQAWAPLCQKDRDLLENVQKRAVRMISGLKSELRD